MFSFISYFRVRALMKKQQKTTRSHISVQTGISLVSSQP